MQWPKGKEKAEEVKKEVNMWGVCRSRNERKEEMEKEGEFSTSIKSGDIGLGVIRV
jgi:hypothetical protein